MICAYLKRAQEESVDAHCPKSGWALPELIVIPLFDQRIMVNYDSRPIQRIAINIDFDTQLHRTSIARDIYCKDRRAMAGIS